MIDKEVSARISLLRYPLILAIVFFHTGAAFTYGPLKNDPHVVAVVRFIFTNMLGSMGVPLFFLISGYLFFKGFEPTAECYGAKLKSRLRTAGIPYVLWNGMVLGFKAVAAHVPGLAAFNTMSEQPLSGSAPVKALLFIWYFFTAPAVGQFWFIRDLIILCAVSPLLWLGAKKAPLPVLAALAVLWLSRAGLPVPFLHDAYQSVPFFFAGAVIWTLKTDLKKLDTMFASVAALYCAVFAGMIVWFSIAPEKSQLLSACFSATLVLGMIFFWTLTSRVRRPEGTLAFRLAGFSFFLFAAHTPFLDIVQKVYIKVLAPRGGGAAACVLFFDVPDRISGPHLCGYCPEGCGTARVLCPYRRQGIIFAGFTHANSCGAVTCSKAIDILIGFFPHACAAKSSGPLFLLRAPIFGS